MEEEEKEDSSEQYVQREKMIVPDLSSLTIQEKLQVNVHIVYIYIQTHRLTVLVQH